MKNQNTTQIAYIVTADYYTTASPPPARSPCSRSTLTPPA